MKPTIWTTLQTQEQRKLLPWLLPAPAQHDRPAPANLAVVAQGYTPISLMEMDSVALLDRFDTKFVMTHGQLLQALQELQNDYRILSVYGQRLSHYRTLYFDTPDFALYNLHVNGRADRYKVRSREYVDSQRFFFEVKHKINTGRTIKDRIPTEHPLLQMDQEASNWLHGVFPYDCRTLEPKLSNSFTRLTLVSKNNCERVTVDVDLTFSRGSRTVHLDGIAIAEVKMDGGKGNSAFLKQMQAQRIHPSSFSKYCIGVSLLYDQVKKNTLKPRVLWLERMTGGMIYDCLG